MIRDRAHRAAAGFGDDGGASAVEYALLLAGIAALIVMAIFFLGGNTREALSRPCQNWAAQDSTAC